MKQNSISSLIFIFFLALTPACFAASVDINHADAVTLARLLAGVGKARAEAIVEYRETHPPFSHPGDLLKVKGIGRSIIERNKSLMRFVIDNPEDATIDRR